MGTVVSIDVRVPGRSPALDRACATGARRLTELDDLFSTWQADSWGSRLARGRVALEDCPLELREAVALARSFESLTDGWFTPGWRTALSADAGPDPTGLVKGLAAQHVSDLLLERGFREHVVNAAGDLVVSGAPGPTWRIGIVDPVDSGALAGVVELPAYDGRWAVATSGPAERGHHVVDPHTGTYPTAVASATVVTTVGPSTTRSAAAADACATGLVAAGERAGALAERLGVAGLRALLVGCDGRIDDPHGLLATTRPAF
jgi:thiamine biosynthesis lipoprotein